MNNVQETRLAKLQHQNMDAWKAVKWLRQNKMLFQRAVYEPMILSLNVSDVNMMKYVEFIIPKRDLLAMFIFEVKPVKGTDLPRGQRTPLSFACRVPTTWNCSSENVTRNRNWSFTVQPFQACC